MALQLFDINNRQRAVINKKSTYPFYFSLVNPLNKKGIIE